ncbi:hypothetical protein [Erythrobacter sp.]|uniref:hypothetical protein n=1 Tax=Erythrobacter sp. TaxID=1042 RepID=UPI003C73685C
MNRVFSLLAATLALTLSAAAFAAGKVEEVVHHETAPSALDPDKAYLLFTSSRAKSGIMTISHVVLRVPNETELAEYREAKLAAYNNALPRLQRQARGGQVVSLEEFDFRHDGPENLFAFDLGKSLDRPERGVDGTYLVEVPPGDYILYGIGVGTRLLSVCNCLGTVRFEAKGGEITHVGGLYADTAHNDSPVPYIEDGLGEDMMRYGFVLSQALVPADGSTPVPASLAAFPRRIADFQPVGAFRDPAALGINRLAPIPGLLEYDRGRVVHSAGD